MSLEKKATSEMEWKINMGDGSSKILVPEAGLTCRVWRFLKDLIAKLVMKVWRFLKKAWDLGVGDPRKVIHCLKVGMALTVVSLFYYMRPLYDGLGGRGSAMWAIMTVVVVFENTVGATIYKCLNRVCGTSLAGFLALGVHWVASQSGPKFEPLMVGASVFLLASAATFSRFIPSVKARFDYGAMIFVLTFSLVTVSGYRVDNLFDLAHQRISTIIIGTSLCIFVSMLVCPIWAGQELHITVCRNLDKLAGSLDGCVAEYFSYNGEDKQSDTNLLGYKCVLSSKATEESMANFARWEPAHGHFSFKHPWKQYLKIGASMRSCAYCVEALNGCLNSENQVPEFIKNQLSNVCLRVSSSSSDVVRELAKTIRTTRKSSTIDTLIEEMSSSVEELKNALRSLSCLFNPPKLVHSESNKTETISAAGAAIPLIEVIPLVTLASLLIEIAARIEAIVDGAEELAKLAEFKVAADNSRIASCQQKEEESMKTLQRV